MSRLALDPDGTCTRYVSGGYPVLHYSAKGTAYCAACATEALRRVGDPEEYIPDPPSISDAHYEGDPIQCEACLPGFSGCTGDIESAYGLPDDLVEEDD